MGPSVYVPFEDGWRPPITGAYCSGTLVLSSKGRSFGAWSGPICGWPQPKRAASWGAHSSRLLLWNFAGQRQRAALYRYGVLMDSSSTVGASTRLARPLVGILRWLGFTWDPGNEEKHPEEMFMAVSLLISLAAGLVWTPSYLLFEEYFSAALPAGYTIVTLLSLRIHRSFPNSALQRRIWIGPTYLLFGHDADDPDFQVRGKVDLQ